MDLPLMLFVLGLLIPRSFSLYEDQIGKFDWKQEYIGRVKFAHFDQSSGSTRRLLVATDANVLSALSAKTGEIVWRRIFETGSDGHIDALLYHKNALITASGGCNLLRYWDAASGSLEWESIVPEQAADAPTVSTVQAAVVSEGKSSYLALMTDRQLHFFAERNGAHAWTAELPNANSGVSYRWLFVGAGGNQAMVVGLAPGSHLTVLTFEPETDTVVSQLTYPAAWATAAHTSCVVVGGGSHLVCLDPSHQSLMTAPLSKGGSFTGTPFASLGLSHPSGSRPNLQLLPSPTSSSGSAQRSEFVAALRADHRALLRVEGGGHGQVTLVKDLPEVLHCTGATWAETTLLFAARHGDNSQELRVDVYDVSDGSEQSELSQAVRLARHHGGLEALYLYTFSRKDKRSAGCRLLLQTQDHALSMLQQPGKVLWSREEALASIVSTEMVDLPLSDTEAKIEDEFSPKERRGIVGAFIRRITGQLELLKTYFEHLKRHLLHSASGGRHREVWEEDNNGNSDGPGAEQEEEEYLTRDQFNQHKLIVVATEAGKLFGLDSEDGTVVWKRYLPNLATFSRNQRKTLLLFVQRTTAHFPHAPQATVIGRDKVSGRASLFSFNPTTGKPSYQHQPQAAPLQYPLLQAVLLHSITDQEYLKPILLLDHQLEVHVYPPESRSDVLGSLGATYLFTIREESGQIDGYTVRVQGSKIGAHPVWNVRIPRDQKIVQVAGKRPTEHVYSQGRVLGDRSVMYKFLNPNLVAIATESLDASGKGVLSVYLLDAVSGSIVFSAVHKKSEQPFFMVHSEHWVVYTYWSSKFRRHEITVLELFETEKTRNSTVFSSLSPPELPLVLRQSFILPTALQSMAVTLTEKGISNKHLLLSLQNGGLLSLPKSVLDPRRPVTPTYQHREEGVHPYIPEIPLRTDAYINYNQTVLGVRGIQTSAAALESTCLVFTYGLDLFYTRVFPSQMFDVLKEDFDYLLIVSVLFGLVILMLVTKKLAARKFLHKVWK